MNASVVRRVGRYALYGEFASGGMASVHLGRMLGPIGFSRTVAIKSLHPHVAKDPEFVAMFLDEARLAARVQHPNVVSTLDVVTRDGQVFLVMEYVHGETLARLNHSLRETGSRMPARIATSIVAGALLGLHAAHEATNEHGEPLDIVHRDVSPQNVIVGIDGGARVLDFGIAKATERHIQTTREGHLKGKLAYMAPEQLRGGHVNRQTDVYAASVVLWEALAGERLFRGQTEGEVLDRVLHAPVDPPSQRAGAPLPPGLDAIVLRGLARERRERFSTARELALALQSCEAAPATEVGEWVEAQAVDVLVDRARWIARIESDSAGGADGSKATLSPIPSLSTPEAIATETFHDIPAAARPRTVTRPSMILGAVVAALLITMVVRTGLRRTDPVAAVSARPLAVSPPSAPALSSSAEPSLPPSASASLRGPPPAAASPKPRAIPTVAPGCNPPYTLSATGRKTYKRNCL